jgi:hypothetical protein
MSAEMTIKLVDASPEEQQALNTVPNPQNATGNGADGKESASDRKDSEVATDDLKTAVNGLADKLSPKLFSDPIDRLIAHLDSTPPIQTKDNRLPDWPNPQSPPVQGQQVIPPPVQTEQNRQIPKVEPISETDKPASSTVSITQILDKLQDKLAKTLSGRQANKFISRARSTFGKVAKATGNAVKRFGKTEIGRVVMPRIGKAAKLVKQSPLGQAAGKAGQTVLGAVGRAVGIEGATAATGAATATTAAAGSTGAGAGVAAGAAVASNPVTLTVAAVVAGLAAIPIAAAATAKGLQMFGDYLISQTGNLTEKSGAISAAKARQETSTELNMIKRAQDVGPGIAKLVDAQTRYQDATEELWTSILGILVKAAPAIEAGADGITALIRGLDLGVAQMEVAIAALTPDGGQDDAAAATHKADAAVKFADAMFELFDDQSNKPDQRDQFLMDLLKASP